MAKKTTQFSTEASDYLVKRADAFEKQVGERAMVLASEHEYVSRTHVREAESEWRPRGSPSERAARDSWGLAIGTTLLGLGGGVLLSWPITGQQPEKFWLGLASVFVLVGVAIAARAYPVRK